MIANIYGQQNRTIGDINDDGEIIASGGIVELWPEHGDAWFFGTHHVPRHIKSIVKVLRKSIEIIAEEKNYKRAVFHQR